VRTTSGGAEIHAHYDDLMIVEQGNATLITGGTVIDAKTDSDGEDQGHWHPEREAAGHCG